MWINVNMSLLYLAIILIFFNNGHSMWKLVKTSLFSLDIINLDIHISYSELFWLFTSPAFKTLCLWHHRFSLIFFLIDLTLNLIFNCMNLWYFTNMASITIFNLLKLLCNTAFKGLKFLNMITQYLVLFNVFQFCDINAEHEIRALIFFAAVARLLVIFYFGLFECLLTADD